MRLTMSEHSLFAILLRSRWWASAAIAAGIAGFSRALLPQDLWPFGAAGALPFLVISVIAARRQWHTPSAARVAAVAVACQAMSRVEFIALLTRALSDAGHRVQPADPAALLAEKAGRRTLYGCARWKAASNGIEALEALDAIRARHAAHDAAFVALGEVAQAARVHAARSGIRIVGPAELTVLLRGSAPRA